MSLLQRLLIAGMIVPGVSTAPALSQSASAPGDTFVLGTIYVSADEEAQGGTTSTVTGEDAAQGNRVTLEDTLAVLPGVSSVSHGGGSRNERQVYVRGFNRWHVPLSIDGIRIYLPADNRLDYGRFLTPDLSEIQVQKGYVPVVNGPGGMGGAINLVTRKPTQPFEGEARIGAEAGNRGDVTGKSGYLSLGTMQELWYAQLTYMYRETDGFYLSRKFDPVPQQGSGLRDNTDTEDSRLNLKLGYTPNATDEYVLSYTRQTGAKSAPYNILLPIRGIPGTGTVGTQRDWTWPKWDISSLAFYSQTELDSGTLKTRVYYNTFDNTLSAWDDSTHSSQTVGRAFNSLYDDYSLGASVSYGTSIGAHDLTAALHFRRDIHRSTNYPQPTNGLPADETEYSKEETVSIALEDRWQVSNDLKIVGGLSFDKARVLEADRTASDPGEPRVSTEALNWQIAAIWTPEAGGTYHASASSRTSFPTLFHRYSTGFGAYVPNPDLKAERALNLELGYSGDLGPVTLEGAVFYSRVSDLIQSVSVGFDPVGGGELAQRQNLAKATYKGVELAARWEMNDRLGLMANYTWLDTSISDPVINGARVTDIPKHKAYLRLDWQATDRLTVAPSVELYGPRWSDPAIGSGDRNNPIYARMDSFALANLDMNWQVAPRMAITFGVRNLFDRDVQMVEGFPEPGRTFHISSQIKF